MRSLALNLASTQTRRPSTRASLGLRLYRALHERGYRGVALWALFLLP